MNIPTPQSMRSPISPYAQQSKQSFASHYPTNPQPNQGGQGHGLALFGCSLPQQSTIHNLPPSPQPSEGWQQQSMMEQDYSQWSQPPDISSAAFDPFSGFSAQSNTGMMSSNSPEAPGLVFCQTPPSINMPSHRSSISSSYASSDSSYQHNSDMYTPKVKVEDASDWYPSPGNEQVLQRSLTTQGLPPYSSNVSPVSSPAEDLYRTQAADWPRPQATGYPLDLHTTENGRRATYDGGAPLLPSIGRVKKKRQRTTPEEATHECRVCGKLFKRSYNWKSHMETHNPERKYPHPCTAMVGNTQCTKKFQRKTDLDRHYDSVHLKARNHRCTLCGNRFARRDTLRRHTEDGCPKRLELGLREGPGAAPARWALTNFPARNRSYSLGVPQPPPQAAPATNFVPYSRPEFVSSPTMVSPVYAS